MEKKIEKKNNKRFQEKNFKKLENWKNEKIWKKIIFFSKNHINFF